MAITVCELSEQNLRDVNRCDNLFTGDSKLVLWLENGSIRHAEVGAPPFQKRYPCDEIDASAYLADPNRMIFFAYLGGELAGQVILRTNWNRFAYVEDIAVDVHRRRRGVGRVLMDQAVGWAKARNLPGIMLETQNNNVAACRFYQQYGFTLGGFDACLYQGIAKDTEEIALFWYLLF